MTSVATKILLALEKSGEMSLEDVSKIIPKRHGDHRDFYVLASLVSRGLIDDPWLPNDGAPSSFKKNTKEQLLSRKLYAMSSGDKTATYENHTWSVYGDKETLKGQRLAISGIGQISLDESRTKRFDRAFGIGSGVIVGIVVALAVVLIERYIKGV